MTTIEELELFCKHAYESENSEIRSRAEQACLSLSDTVNGFEMSRLLLERGNSHYSQLVAISTMSKLLNKNQIDLSVDQRLEIRNMCLNYLIQRDGLADFVVRAIVGLICRITKLGWLDTNKEECFIFREMIEPLMDMIKSGQPKPMLISVQILYSLVYEFNQSYEGEITRSTIVMRKIANNFRENQLYTIFLTSIELLGKMSSNIKSLNLYDNLQHAIVQYSLKLTLACLSYDFIGTCGGEEVSDDMMSVQVPTNWRQAFLSPSDTPDPVPLFFRLYESLPASLGNLALACLVQAASFRRSFFNNNERQLFLGQLVSGVCDILCTAGGGGGNGGGAGGGALQEASCYHELCRLVCRLKSNFQLGELVALPGYTRFIELLAQFTVRSLESGDSDSGNSQHYLLLTWQRLVASLPYLRCSQPHLLDTHCPTVLDAYVRSRMRSALQLPQDSNAGNSGGNTNSTGSNGPWGDLEDAVSVPQELEAVAVLSRCQYGLSVSRLVALFDDIAARFATEGSSNAVSRLRELCWLVLLMGACISGRIGCAGSSDDNDRLDGELVARVLQLAGMIDTDCVASNAHLLQALAGLEVAVLAFLDQIRRVYLCGESCIRAVRLYEVLQQRIAISDDNALLETLVQKILVNLRCWGGLSRPVISRSLALLHELSLGTVAKRLMKLPVVISLLESHSPLQLPFLMHSCQDPQQVAFGSAATVATGGGNNGGTVNSSNSASNDMYRHNAVQLTTNVTGASSNPRTCFYASLTRLFLLSPRADEPAVFLGFMAPLTHACDSLTQALMTATGGGSGASSGGGGGSGQSQVTVGQQQVTNSSKLALLALIRDVRGVATACHSKCSFQALFDWLYPAMLSHLLVAIDLWGPTEQCGLSLGCLKLAGELSLSRNNRLQPQVASPSGELMFRVCSRILICYGDKINHERLSSIRSNKTQYLLYIKEATACIDILRNLLTGNYVNLGAFALYADDSLEKCLHIFLQLMVSIPPDDMMAYPKLARSYYCLADSLTQDHLIWLGTQQPEMILYFVNTICDGLISTSLAVSSSCCSSLDNVVSFLLRLAQSQLVSNNSIKPCHPNQSNLHLSDNVRASIDHFLMTSQHLDRRESESREKYCRLMESSSGQLTAILSRSMENLFQALMQPECKNQWAMSRPLLGLILLNNKAFEDLQQCYTSSASQESLKNSFEKLMEDVNCSLSIRNRDKFTQNLNTFRHNLNGSNKLNVDYHSSNSIEMIA